MNTHALNEFGCTVIAVLKPQLRSSNLDKQANLVVASQIDMLDPLFLIDDESEPEFEKVATTVLAVDDDRATRDALKDVLGYLGYIVIGVRDGAEALEYLRQMRLPDVVLLDLGMPIMDGWSLRDEMLNDPRLSPLPIIVMTASPNESAEELQVVEILKKPVELKRLIASIERCSPTKTYV
jgi:CheY-like chemotaxis protein